MFYRTMYSKAAGNKIPGRRERRGLSLLFLLLIGSLSSASTELRGQSGDSLFSLRLISALEFGLPGTITRSPGALNTAELKSPGTGTLQGIGGSVALEWGKMNPQRGEFGFAVRLGATMRTGRFLSNPYSRFGPAISSVTGDTVAAEYRFTVEAGDKQLEGALLGLWGLSGRSSLFAGGWLGYRFDANIVQTESIVSPLNAIYPEAAEDGTRPLAEGEGLAAYPLRFGGIVGGRMELGTISSLIIEPELFFRFDGESLFRNGIGLSAFSGGVGLGIRFGADDRISKEKPEETFSVPPLALSSSVRLYEADLSGSERENAVLRPQQTVHRRYMPLVPLFSATQVLSSSFRLPNVQAADAFRMESLYDLSPAELAGYGVNILGERMRELPEVGVEIRGERVEEVKDYLVKVWGINGERISVASGDAATPDRIEVIPSDPSLLFPLAQRWVVDEFAPLRIALGKKITAEAGLRRWELSVRQGEKLLGHHHSDSANGGDSVLTLEGFSGGSDLLPLEAELIVEDYRGMRDTAHSSLPLQRKEEAPIEVDLLEYLLPDPALHPSVADANHALLNHLSGAVQTGAVVHITGEFRQSGSGAAPSVEKIAAGLLSHLDERGIKVRSITADRAGGKNGETGYGAGIRILVRQQRDFN